MPISQGTAGPAAAKIPDTQAPLSGIRLDNQGGTTVSELHGKYYEHNYRGLVWSNGMTLTSISASTFIGTTATATPIAGVWNPSTSQYNLEILTASLSVTYTAATNTGGAPFVWASSVGNTAITTGSAPFNRKTLATGTPPSGAKGFAGVALTGLTNNLAVFGASGLGGGSGGAYSEVDTAVGFSPVHYSTTEYLDGQIIVPPGGVLALLATTQPVAHSAASMLVWVEIPV